MITLTTLGAVPPIVQGLVRDLRVRWALEEAGLPYRTRLLDGAELSRPDHLARQPFGQVPALEIDGLELFESGAILLHLGETALEAGSEALLPRDPAARARARVWLLAGLDSIEPPIAELAGIDIFFAEKDWAKVRRPGAEAAVRKRLGQLEARLGARAGEGEWLEERFTLGDLMVSAVLRNLRHTDLLADYPRVTAHHARCEARPAFRKALADHMAVFAEAA